MWLLCPREMGGRDNRVLSLPEERRYGVARNKQAISHPILCHKPTVRPSCLCYAKYSGSNRQPYDVQEES